LANKIGVRFAIPTQTLPMGSFPEKRSTPSYEGDGDYQKKLDEFFQAELHEN